MDGNDLTGRLFRFAVDTLKFLRTLHSSTDIDIIRYQLSKSSTSSGANYEEAQSASSRKDFKHKVEIAFREMRESNYWYRILNELEEASAELERLLKESAELKAILGSIGSKTKD